MCSSDLVVRSFRVLLAGAFLPLTRSPKVEKTLGTRHRAGIGITEDTDAIAVVVSEERGTISLCRYGQITTGLDPAQLRKELLALFAAPKKPWRPVAAKVEDEAEREQRPVEKADRPADKDGTDGGRPSTWPGRERHERPSTGGRPRSSTWGGTERGERPPVARPVAAKPEE